MKKEIKIERRDSDDHNTDQKVPSSSPADSTVENETNEKPVSFLQKTNLSKQHKIGSETTKLSDLPPKLRFKVIFSFEALCLGEKLLVERYYNILLERNFFKL